MSYFTVLSSTHVRPDLLRNPPCHRALLWGSCLCLPDLLRASWNGSIAPTATDLRLSSSVSPLRACAVSYIPGYRKHGVTRSTGLNVARDYTQYKVTRSTALLAIRRYTVTRGYTQHGLCLERIYLARALLLSKKELRSSCSPLTQELRSHGKRGCMQ